MCRSNLHGSRSELRFRNVIQDDRNLTLHEREQHFLPMQMRVPVIRSIHRHRRIAEHRLRTRRRYRDELVRPDDGITNLIQLPRNIFVFHFEIRDRSAAIRTPVHNVLPAINQPLFIQPDEHFAHRARQVLVHREVLAPPIDRHSQALHLLENRSAIEPFPVPHTLDKLLATHLESRLAFAAQLPVHHHLRSDAGMVRPRQPQSEEPAHAMPAHKNIHLRLVEHVPHVQPSRHIRRWQQQREHWPRVARRRRLHVEQFFADPVLRPARFSRARLVGFRQFVRHG